MRLKKWQGNPILEPTGRGDWEAVSVCNPGACYDGGKIHLLYRAAGERDIYKIHIGLATSEDGYHFKRESERPIYTPVEQYEAGCVEDPRIVKFGDHFYVTYACRAVPDIAFMTGRGPKFPDTASKSLRMNMTRTGLLRSRDLRTFERLGPITWDTVDDRHVVIFPEKVNGKYVMLHRPSEWVGPKYHCERPSIWMGFSDDMFNWRGDVILAQPDTSQAWQRYEIGAGAPPIKTPQGWLVIYHGVQGRGEERIYRNGVMMLDLNDPRKVISRPADFILEPTEPYERAGIENNVVFATGNVVVGDEVLVYYGGADRVCCVATAKLKDLMDYAMSAPVK